MGKCVKLELCNLIIINTIIDEGGAWNYGLSLVVFARVE